MNEHVGDKGAGREMYLILIVQSPLAYGREGFLLDSIRIDVAFEGWEVGDVGSKGLNLLSTPSRSP